MNKISGMLFRLIYTTFFLLLKNISYSQEEQIDNRFSQLAIVGSPTPTAASLGVYGNYPVGNYTGLPSIDVPLYELNAGGYKIPISLSYNASGIKVSDIASWVGMGWSLNAGGIITRNVNSVPDDYNGGSSSYGFLQYNFFVSPQSVSNSNNNSWTTGYNPSSHISQNLHGLRELRMGSMDTEPDIFFFNFNGHVGKFVFSQGTTTSNYGSIPSNQHKIYTIPYQDLDFQYSLNPVPMPNDYKAGWINSFTITDEQGNQYLFDKKEETNPTIMGEAFSRYNRYGAHLPGTTGYSISNYYTSWYLSKITTVLGKVINFNYEAEGYQRRFPTAYSVRGFYYGTGIGSNGEPLHGNSFDNSNPCVYERSYCSKKEDIFGLRLKSIETDDTKIQFDANVQRQDLINTSALSSVKIYSKDSYANITLIKKFDFNYSYLQSPAETIDDYFPLDAGSDKRLMLNSVTETGADNSIKPPYQFSYNNDYPLPNRYSVKQDFWGYFNNNSSKSLIPTLYVYPDYIDNNEKFTLFPRIGVTNYFVFDGADRTTNVDAIKSGTLTGITFPTGGSTTFQFEPKVFRYLNQDIVGGGLRLKKSIAFDGLNHTNDVIKEYEYKKPSAAVESSGVLFNLPVYAYTENFVDPSNFYGQNGPYPNSLTRDYYKRCLVIGSAPNYTLSGYDGLSVGYSYITENASGNGRTVSRYSTPGGYGVWTDDPDDDIHEPCDFEESGTCDDLFRLGKSETYYQGYCCTDYDNFASCVADNNRTLDLTGVIITPHSFPFAPVLNYDWNRGLLLSQKTYANNNTLLNEVVNKYKVFTPKNSAPKYTYGLRMARMSNYHIYWGGNCDWSLLHLYDIVTLYPIISQVAKVISQREEKIYDNGGNAITVTKKYSYNYNSLQPNQIEILQSDGTSVITNATYVSDLNLSASSTNPEYVGYKNLNDKHAVYNVIEEYSQKKYPGDVIKILGGYFVTYKSNIPLPSVSYKLAVQAPLNDFSVSQIMAGGVSKDVRYKKKVVFDQYDADGNILNQHLENNISQCYIWGYEHRYTVAQIIGKSYGDAVSLSGIDLNIINNSTTTDAAMRMELDKLRTLSNCLVTTSTYKPLIGMTSQTDPNGRTTYYEYDTFGRLLLIRDKDNNVLKKFEYKYTGQ